jgi:hypothetical protein
MDPTNQEEQVKIDELKRYDSPQLFFSDNVLCKKRS